MSFLKHTFFLNQSEWAHSFEANILQSILQPISVMTWTSHLPSTCFIFQSTFTIYKSFLLSSWLPIACTLFQSQLISQPMLVGHFSCLPILQLISVTISSMAFTIITLSLFFCSVLSPKFQHISNLAKRCLYWNICSFAVVFTKSEPKCYIYYFWVCLFVFKSPIFFSLWGAIYVPFPKMTFLPNSLYWYMLSVKKYLLINVIWWPMDACWIVQKEVTFGFNNSR